METLGGKNHSRKLLATLAKSRCVRRDGAMCAQVLGDRSLKLKYLNPNTLFVVTGSLPGQAKGSARHVTAHIFDTITGQLLFSQIHQVSSAFWPRCQVGDGMICSGS